MGVYADSSKIGADDPKVETIIELLVRVWVSTIKARLEMLFSGN